MSESTINNHAAFIWSVADLLRGNYKQSDYGKVILPLTVLRRFDAVIDPVKEAMLAKYGSVKDTVDNFGPILDRLTDIKGLWNTSKFDLNKLLDDPDHLADNLRAYIAAFSPQVRDIIANFDLDTQIANLESAGLLHKVLGKFAEIDLHPDKISNLEMGYIYEELVRRFYALSNETAGEHFTPREVISLMVNLLFIEDDNLLTKPGIAKTLFDPACGTGGMLSVAEDHLRELNPTAQLEVFGQELKRETAAVCRADVMLRGHIESNISIGNSFSEDGHQGKQFDYLLSRPPFGIEWRNVKEAVEAEQGDLGFNGRFGAGLPRISDGSFLFLQHMISKMKRPEDGGSRVGIVTNGSPLFAGAAGSGESEIRRWIIENDWLETVVALPNQLFYNTGNSTYFWILSNRKSAKCRGKVQLIDARSSYTKMRKSLGQKRKVVSASDCETVVRRYTLSDEQSRTIETDDLLEQPDGAVRIEPWMFDPAIGERTHVRLADLAEPITAGLLSSALPILGAADLDAQHLADHRLAGAADPGRRFAVCQGGDVVGRGRRWQVLPASFGTAATSLEVLRPIEVEGVDPHLLSLWLSSEECFQQMSSSVVPRVRRDFMVPRRLRSNETLAGAAQELSEARAEARRLLDDMLDDPFEFGGAGASSDSNLLAQASNARAVRALLQPLDDVVHRAEWQYPYQVAKAARDYRLAVSVDRQLDAALLLAESLIRTVGLFAAAIALSHDRSLQPQVLQPFSGGISSGSWLQILREAQDAGALEMYPELGSISFKKKGLGETLQACVNMRNQLAHATGMRSTAERKERLDELNPLLIGALEQSTWLGLFEMVRVDACAFTTSGYEVHGRRLNGSHPDWEPTIDGLPEPVLPERVYLRTPRTGLVDLSPFAMVSSCSECKLGRVVHSRPAQGRYGAASKREGSPNRSRHRAVSETTINNHAAFIWSVADLLRGNYKQSEYGKVILPLTVLRRFDAVIDPVKEAMLAKYGSVKGTVDNFGPILDRLTDIKGLWNTSKFDLNRLLDDPDHLADNLRAYIAGFSPQVRDIIENFDLDTQIAKLDKANLLYKVLGKFAELDLHPDTVSNIEMGYLYEELIRRFSELSNETAGEHFTPREVIRLMVNLLFIEDDNLLTKPGIAKTLFDPACGTGGMLSVAEDHLRALNPAAQLQVFGQELNPETYAVCRSDMMLKGQNAENIVLGNSFSEDGHEGKQFDYLLANPPFGVEWKNVKEDVESEHNEDGYGGRFGAGLPRINDGSFLFIQHMISKMKRHEDGGSRVAIVFNGSPLFTGAAGSGESEIRRWIIENDWLEAIVALPDQLFYNTGISTYFWIVTNRKSPSRRGKVQLIDARESFTKMRKSLGEKRKQVADEQIADIVRIYGGFDHQQSDDDARCKIFANESFGFMRITVERPLCVRWEVTDATVASVRASKSYAELAEYELDTDPDRTYADLLDLALAKAAGTQVDSQADFDVMLGQALEAAWNEIGSPFDEPLKAKPGLTAECLELTAAKARKLLDEFQVRDADADPQTDKKGNPEPDAELRDNENVPLPDAIVVHEADPSHRLATPAYRAAVDQYVKAEVHPYVPDAWVDHDKTKLGYEIPLTRHFYTYTPPRPLEEIDAEIKALEAEIQALLAEVTE